MNVLRFKCPKCKGGLLVEIVTGQWSRLFIEGVTPDGEVICGHEDWDGDGEHWFECGTCGYVLEDLTDSDELLEWMQKRRAYTDGSLEE